MSTNPKSRFTAGVADSVESIWYDNEHDPWRLVHPANRPLPLEWTHADLDELMLPTGHDTSPVINVDALGKLLLWLVGESDA